MYKKILVPLDGSNRAESILPFVQSMAGSFGATVVLLKVDEPSLLLGFDEVIDMANYHLSRQKQRQETETYLSGIATTLRAKDIEPKNVVESGDVVKTILEVANREGADLVAMFSQAGSDLKRPLYKSIAAGLLQQSDRPLLISRSRRQAA